MYLHADVEDWDTTGICLSRKQAQTAVFSFFACKLYMLLFLCFSYLQNICIKHATEETPLCLSQNHLVLQPSRSPFSDFKSKQIPWKKGPPELKTVCGAQQANVCRICDRGNTTLLVPKPPNITFNSTWIQPFQIIKEHRAKAKSASTDKGCGCVCLNTGAEPIALEPFKLAWNMQRRRSLI